jgi:hypothetical protein
MEDEIQSKFKNNSNLMIAALKRGDISIFDRPRMKQSSDNFIKKRESKYFFKSSKSAAEDQTRLLDELRTEINHA